MEPPPSSFEMNPVITAFPPTPPAASLSNLALHEGGVEKNEERSSPPARGGTHQTDPNEEESGPDDEVGDEELGLELATNSTSGEILGSADNQGQELGRSSLSFLSADGTRGSPCEGFYKAGLGLPSHRPGDPEREHV
ncbi:hypothetical protein TrVE_jg542 [Triparma verrucosa]|uniref:Uncharacterized protein n=1 Tax=Triparma verrucosa TaxID=1606542 RepID=A0A9W7BA45_9STRA|nr:hypothetical protein TrVE_jg542 [Triparma verrucosa]